MLLTTGFVLWLTRRIELGGRPAGALTWKDALCVGFVQGLAILPGISRSGSTIAIALLRGIERETAARYSFLLSIPAILGALVLACMGMSGATDEYNLAVILSGAFVAFLVGFFALKLLVRLIQRGRFFLFAPYCWALGLFCLIYSFVTG
jgi:undecaprenyl-diphosphatase